LFEDKSEEIQSEEKKSEKIDKSSAVNFNSLTSNKTLDSVGLIKAQCFNGSYSFAVLQQLIPTFHKEKLTAVLNSEITYTEKVEGILVTLIICNYFEIVFKSNKTLWELVVKKARNWAKKEIETITPSLPNYTDFNLAATTLLAAHGIQ